MKTLLKALYESEINILIDWMWDSGIQIKIGDRMNGVKEAVLMDVDFDEIERWIELKAKEHYPDSKFAKTYNDNAEDNLEPKYCIPEGINSKEKELPELLNEEALKIIKMVYGTADPDAIDINSATLAEMFEYAKPKLDKTMLSEVHSEQREIDVQRLCQAVLDISPDSWDNPNGAYETNYPFCHAEEHRGGGVAGRSIWASMSELDHESHCVYLIAKDLSTNCR